jgi:hypothetical protein
MQKGTRPDAYRASGDQLFEHMLRVPILSPSHIVHLFPFHILWLLLHTAAAKRDSMRAEFAKEIITVIVTNDADESSCSVHHSRHGRSSRQTWETLVGRRWVYCIHNTHGQLSGTQHVVHLIQRSEVEPPPSIG